MKERDVSYFCMWIMLLIILHECPKNAQDKKGKVETKNVNAC